LALTHVYIFNAPDKQHVIK